MKKSFREDVYTYVQNKYKSKIEYLWIKFPGYTVFRHHENNKWYGIIMNVPYRKLGINKDGEVDILNIKLNDWLLKDILMSEKGILPGYHSNKKNWISILLDGTLSKNKIFSLIDEGYLATASKSSLKK